MTQTELLSLLRLARLTLDDKQATTGPLKKRLDAAIAKLEAPYAWKTHRSGIVRLDDPRVPASTTVVITRVGGWWNWAIEHDGIGGRSTTVEAAQNAALAALGIE